MNYEIEFSIQAEADLRGIYEYIAFILLAPENAKNQIERLEKSIMELSFMPERFKKYEKEPWHSRNLRIMPVDNFIVFFIPNMKKGIITVICIIYEGRNMDSELLEHTKL